MNRIEILSRMSEFDNDLLIIGGGATGFAIAVDALSRGYSVALFERGDFGEGTSSRSTKLIHGGVRYLRQGHLPLVYESLHERSWFLGAAPELVHPLEFVVPCRSRWEQFFYRTGMGLYDLLAGRDRVENSRLLSRDEVMGKVPGCYSDGLAGGVSYADGQFDDARMIMCFLRHVLKQGGTALNYAAAKELIKEGGRVAGAVIEDVETGTAHEVRAKAVINATGPFTDGVCRMDEPETRQRIAPSQGIHLVLDASFLGGSSALMIPKTVDGRVLFAIPWHGRVLYGTTDTPRPEVEREPRVLDEEIEYLVDHAHHIFNRAISESDIINTFAGLRPLPKPDKSQSTASISRKFVLETSASGLITMYGGKWTTCRAMGEAAVERAVQVAGLEHRPSTTRELVFKAENEPATHLDAPPDEWVRYAVREEMARTANDVLLRRTRLGLLDPAKAEACRAGIESEISNLKSQITQ